MLPRWPALLSGILYLGIGLLCLIYATGLIGLLSGLIPNPQGGGANFTTIEGVRSIFGSDGGVTIGWTHYLAFDLFIGAWILRDARREGFAHWVVLPILPFVFLVGPAGFVAYLTLKLLRRGIPSTDTELRHG